MTPNGGGTKKLTNDAVITRWVVNNTDTIIDAFNSFYVTSKKFIRERVEKPVKKMYGQHARNSRGIMLLTVVCTYILADTRQFAMTKRTSSFPVKSAFAVSMLLIMLLFFCRFPCPVCCSVRMHWLAFTGSLEVDIGEATW